MVNFEQIIHENKENNISGNIKSIELFKTWFNENLAIVISFFPTSYEAKLVIYEPAERRLKNILAFIFITRDSKLDEVKRRIGIFKKNLNDDNPAMHFTFPQNIAEIRLPSNIIHIDPDNHIKPLDIIKIQRNGYRHVAIYLINGKVCHVEGAEGKAGGLTNKTNSVGVRIADWKTFLSDNPGDVTRYHAVIPFKRAEKIIKHIEKSLMNEYGKGKYHLLLRNCEHFANMCVYGINSSEQVEEYKVALGSVLMLQKEIEESDEIFTNLTTSRQLTAKEERIIKKLQMITKVTKVTDSKETKETLKGWFSFWKIFGAILIIYYFYFLE
ncbi:hypothetical protein C1645_825714 [Glomus cerebriforme]|uniref:phospholipase A2 n=1 Tax=Glomus cerebriforme TaxID=658196 RepID=A0A397SYC5_9GLOM|nr:hypothetical protein C1645_825714 [Glomus cerebriforme]